MIYFIMSERSFSPNSNYINFNYNNNFLDSDKLSNYSFKERNYHPVKDLNNSFDYSIGSNNPFDIKFSEDKLNHNFYPKENDFGYFDNKMDQATTKFTEKFSQKKRQRSPQKKTLKKAKKEKEVNSIVIKSENKNNMGRKKKNDSQKGLHTKNKPDNVMRKIKSNFFNLIHNLLNKSLSNKDIQFLKLKSKINKELKRDFNIELLNRTIRDIYENSDITSKLRKQSEINSKINKDIISKIYEEKIEVQTIKILNLTYFELFQIFRSKIKSIDSDLESKKDEIPLLNTDEFSNIDRFFEKIANEEENNNESQESIDNYINQIKELCIGYEDWFFDKKGRKRIKKIKKE